MPDQTPQYIQPPRNSGAAIVVGILLAVFLLLAVCGAALLGFGFFAYTAVDVQMQPPAPQPVVEGAQAIEPVDAAKTPREPDAPSP